MAEMKNTTKYILQKILGIKTYMSVFTCFKIKTLHLDKKENDFFLFQKIAAKSEGNMLDIGANLGVMSYHLAKKFPERTIFAFEPMPLNLEVIQKIKAKNQLKNLHIFPVALGETEGEVKMILPKNGNTVMQGLSHVKHESIQEWNEGDEFSVAMKTLDSLNTENVFGKIAGIKIDIENFEYFALKGGEALLNENKPLIYAELWDNENRNRCFDLLKNLGYSIFVSENKQLVPFQKETHSQQNFFFKVH